MIFYDPKHNRLVYTDQKANKEFWDRLWAKNEVTKKNHWSNKIDLLVKPTTKKYLKRGSRILEGGCGHGTYVISLEKERFKCIGIDYAKKTVDILKKTYPSLDFQTADVRKLPFKSSSFDGYWSLGVIEHFYTGYGKIISEMHRVLKKGGYVFIAFPYMSPLRRLKSMLKAYPQINAKRVPKNFYQFALDERKVIKDLNKFGFKLVEKKPYDGVSGLRKEASMLKFILNPLSTYSTKYLPVAGVRFLLSKTVEKFSAHTILLVLKKN